LPFKYFCFLFLLRFIFKNPAISAHFARSRQSPVHHTWIRQILARFTARVLLRPECPEQQALLWQNIPRNHGNLDIMLIPETRSVSLFTLNNPQVKRAQARAR
jgi:hypothetical protein